MSFPHDDAEFGDLLRVVAQKRGLSPGLVEKDYWVTHTLWALHELGLEVWFKGGTSLSKGFGIIERFSEDLDLKIEAGRSPLPRVSSWKSEGAKATRDREAYFVALPRTLRVPGASVRTDPDFRDPSWRSALLRVEYPGNHLAALGPLKPFVLLEIGIARVTPFVTREMSSFVHDELVAHGLFGEFEDNRPRDVRCVHPLVTLLEKLDAVHRRFPREEVAAATFVRHFEDAAHICEAEQGLPPLEGYVSVRELAEEMVAQRQIAAMPTDDDVALRPDDSLRWSMLRRAHEAIAPMFWGRRTSLDGACAALRRWIADRVA